MPARRFDAILVDFYGTISAGDHDAVLAACRRIVKSCKLPTTTEEFAVLWGERFFEVIDRSNHGSFQTLYECEIASLRSTLDSFGNTSDPTPLVAELENYWINPPIYPDALEFLNGVDRPICCVSNADTKPLLCAIEKHNLSFDAVITSEAVRSYKPDPAIFRQAMETLGVDPERTIHVGDSLHSDVAGASSLGITTVWLRRDRRIHDIGKSSPDYEISSLAELGAIVGG